MMIRGAIVAIVLLLAGCASEAVRTPEQAKSIALASVCAKRQVKLDPGETTPTEWLAERKGDRWFAWPPLGPGAQYRGIVQYGHMGAWINAKDGKLLSCEAGKSTPLDQTTPELQRLSPP